jgi:hypothetical protein
MTVCFATSHNNDGFETRRPKIPKSYKKFKKCATINTRYDVKKQHSQSEMRAIPIYHLSQGMRWQEIIGEKESADLGNTQFTCGELLLGHYSTVSFCEL